MFGLLHLDCASFRLSQFFVVHFLIDLIESGGSQSLLMSSGIWALSGPSVGSSDGLKIKRGDLMDVFTEPVHRVLDFIGGSWSFYEELET